ncbi:E3 ubiquitin-protein ligase listerin [Caenorhabditis elegans]|uniref:E3 ubiquitin-protein ligase listerin n=1 Tax=Caenorhabditis elegans TaxID=6239 RepID=LTN1_CAEEL|nr:E3 ubiquitin-protein ligase listerin [Caenorhabditis elegans]Q65XX2.1 RecName: Full=E3 ubiquitin-protein ligase listerin; AltName: Full=RING-type E3 ubiquitin transferase listerin [Caenorhabditis elegans]CCD72830.1 E3 ubiquitin-protein ligase listerin [Caenorhabditis elegans]|eukprot:NP_491118.2 E3 ubiquitin-protein ligase listerin [Caenorhabditis elegans]
MSKQQRRKGNAKNASSAAAHEYLAQGGATFVGLTPEMNIFEVASSNRLHQVVEIDDETRIVMKKLTKKDCQTREKGLKELMELINTENSSIESSYEHFCGLVAQLTTDGSPTVRMLTMKVISQFLTKLKKSASKGLKKIIPFVLFAKSDVTNGVAAAASAVIRDGFDADKKRQVVELFVPNTFDLAAKIAEGKHELSLPAEYDASEDLETRKMRLETQSLNTFLSYIKEYGNESKLWEEPARKLFSNSEFIKKTFAGKKEALKVQLLNISYKFSDNIEVILSNPVISTYIQASLDAQTFSTECATAWEGILILLPDERFHAKCSLQKGIYPRLLNLIRKKGNHWRVLKHYLLPAVSVLLQKLENPALITSIITSFTDNLPWQAEASMNAIHCWFCTFSDFVKWILGNDRINLEILKDLSPLIVEMSNQSMHFNTAEATECISGLIHWIIEKKVLENPAEFFDLLKTSIYEVAPPEKSRLFADSLTLPAKHLELAHLHGNLLSNPDVDFHIIRNLARASNSEYFEETCRNINNFEFIENSDRFDMLQAVEIVKLIEMKPSLSLQIKNNHVGRQLLLSENSEIWEKSLKNVPAGVFQEMVNFWHEKRNGKAIAQAVNFLKKMGIQLDTNAAAENVDFLISLLQSLDSKEDPEERKNLVLKLLSALFDAEDEPKLEHFESLKSHLNGDFEQFFEKLFANMEEEDAERVLEIAARFDKLVGFCDADSRGEIAGKMILGRREFDEMSEKLHFLELDVLTVSQHTTIITDALSRPIEHLEEKEATKMVKELGRLALFSVASNYNSSIHQLFAWQMIRVISALGNRYCLKFLDEELQQLRIELEKRVIKSEEIQKLINDGCCCAPNFITDTYGIPEKRQKFEEYSEDMDTKIETIYLKTDTPLEYVEKVFEASQSENSFPLFQFDQSKKYEWLANLTFVKRFIQCGGEIFRAENLEFRDFTLCGIITVLDTSTDILIDSPHSFSENPLLEALTTLYLELFVVLTDATKRGAYSEQSVEEWNEFYTPTIHTYCIRLFRTIRRDQQPTPFVRALLRALFVISEFPTSFSNDDDVANQEFIPELSVFKYPAFQESCIAQAFSLFASNNEHIQLIAYSVARLLMPIMFKLENAAALKSNEDSELPVSTNRRKLSLPVMISKSYPKDHHNPHVGPLLLDLTLLPLENTKDSGFSQEHRVAYCDVIDPFFKNALNALMLDQPFEFRQVPIGCRIPKSQERAYYLESDLSASPIFFDKFASRLLFKSMTLLPAAIRLFYKGMPNCFMPMFQETVTKYASRLLIEQELGKVREAKFEGEMKVRTVPVTGEIIAEYVVEETKMKLTIGLPPDYPLSVPSLTLDKAIVKTDRAKKWLLQLNAYLFHQNGAILEGIEMWKRNVDKGVEGVEDCTICMMTVHQQTHQLPKIKCKQCKNKFHSNCLYKWFESSNQSTCPLCRNNFT